jgi:hypothetical protein
MACFGYASTLLDHWNGYLVKVKSENVQGKELFFYIFGNRSRKQSKIETNLLGGTEYFILNPGYYFDDGYFFSFQNPSYKSLESENKLNLLEVYLLPFDYLKRLRLVSKDIVEGSDQTIYAANIKAEKLNYYTYRYLDTTKVGQELALYQAYDPGWYAYLVNGNSWLERNLPYLFAQKIDQHYLVNNWANGWQIPEMEKGDYLLILFWPQLLEYVGIVTLILIWNIAIVGAFLRIRSWQRVEEYL